MSSCPIVTSHLTPLAYYYYQSLVLITMAYEEFEEGVDQEEFLELCNFPF
jgi:hypothetical protein